LTISLSSPCRVSYLYLCFFFGAQRRQVIIQSFKPFLILSFLPTCNSNLPTLSLSLSLSLSFISTPQRLPSPVMSSFKSHRQNENKSQEPQLYHYAVAPDKFTYQSLHCIIFQLQKTDGLFKPFAPQEKVRDYPLCFASSRTLKDIKAILTAFSEDNEDFPLEQKKIEAHVIESIVEIE